MTYEERLAEADRLRREHRDILATPLVSEGEISLAQIGMMSESQRKEWRRKCNLKFDIRAQIAALELTDADIAANTRACRVATVEGLITQSWQRIEDWRRVGVGKNGKIRPKYVKLIHDEVDVLTELMMERESLKTRG